jgi:hypothetical protein
VTVAGVEVIDSSLTAQAEFVVAYEYIGMDSTVWNNTCQAIAAFWNVFEPFGYNPLVCNPTVSLFPYALDTCSNQPPVAWELIM